MFTHNANYLLLQLTEWIYFLLQTVFYATLLVKNVRVYRIFHNQRLVSEVGPSTAIARLSPGCESQSYKFTEIYRHIACPIKLFRCHTTKPRLAQNAWLVLIRHITLFLEHHQFVGCNVNIGLRHSIAMFIPFWSWKLNVQRTHRLQHVGGVAIDPVQPVSHLWPAISLLCTQTARWIDSHSITTCAVSITKYYRNQLIFRPKINAWSL